MKPKKKLETVWKTVAKHCAGLKLSAEDFHLHLAVRIGAEPLVSWTRDTHSETQLSEILKLVPAGETNPTGRWFRVTLQGRRIQAYPGSSTLS